MQLHRTSGRPDWASVPPQKYNPWQYVAARSQGIATPGNIITLAGLGLVAVGLLLIARDNDIAWGLVWIALGRLADLLDGWAADKTGTKSPLGEKMDVTCDKIAIGATLIVLLWQHILPLALTIVLAAPHAIISAITLLAMRRGYMPHPSRTGKISMALLWCTLGLLILLQLPAFQTESFAESSPYHLLYTGLLPGILAAASIACGLLAALGYLREFLSRKG